MRILITKLSALGDIVQAWGVLEYLKNRFPDAEIDWVVELSNKALVERHPLVSRAIAIDTKAIRKSLGFSRLGTAWNELRKEKYDYVFDLQGNLKSALCVLASRGKKKIGWQSSECAEFGASFAYTQKISTQGIVSARERNLKLVQRAFDDDSNFVPKSHFLRLNPDEEQFVQSQVHEPFWMICPGSKWQNKVYPFEKLVEVLKSLKNHPNFLFVTGGGVEARLVQDAFPNDRHLILPSLPALQHIMSHAELMIGMDSLPIHLADSVGTKTFALFGPSLSQVYFPPNDNRAVFQGSCPYGKVFDRRCPILRTCPTGACIRDVSPETILESINQSLN